MHWHFRAPPFNTGGASQTCGGCWKICCCGGCGGCWGGPGVPHLLQKAASVLQSVPQPPHAICFGCCCTIIICCCCGCCGGCAYPCRRPTPRILDAACVYSRSCTGGCEKREVRRKPDAADWMAQECRSGGRKLWCRGLRSPHTPSAHWSGQRRRPVRPRHTPPRPSCFSVTPARLLYELVRTCVVKKKC